MSRFMHRGSRATAEYPNRTGYILFFGCRFSCAVKYGVLRDPWRGKRETYP